MSVQAFVAKLAAMPRPFSSNRSSNLRRSTVVRQPASRPEVTRLLCFHKPYGVLSQFTPEGKWQGLKDWIDVPGVYVAGRLDADSEGLLLLTNDGQLQARIADPRHKMEKTYWVQVEGMPDEAALQRLREGVELSDGKTLPAKARLIDPSPDVAAQPADSRAPEHSRLLDRARHPRGQEPPGAPHDGSRRPPHAEAGAHGRGALFD
jgi:23S rRNA pseudouridine2457 synthase